MRLGSFVTILSFFALTAACGGTDDGSGPASDSQDIVGDLPSGASRENFMEAARTKLLEDRQLPAFKFVAEQMLVRQGANGHDFALMEGYPQDNVTHQNLLANEENPRVYVVEERTFGTTWVVKYFAVGLTDVPVVSCSLGIPKTLWLAADIGAECQ